MLKGFVSWVGVLIITVLCLIGWGLTASAAVHVRGYTKKDGTYVAPHYRSSPNSTRSDNWSTRGNVNPYTGKAGTKDPGVSRSGSASAALAPAAAPIRPAAQSAASAKPQPITSSAKQLAEEPVSAGDKLRIAKADRIRELGYTVDWRQHSASELTDMEIKAEKANHLNQLGYPQDWQNLSLAQMEDREKRIETAMALKKRGVTVDWEKSSQAELADVQTRVNLADRLAREGKVVDWQKYSASQLSDMEAEMAKRLR